MTSGTITQIEKECSALSVRQVLKRYGSVTANDRVDFDLRYGSVHALLGENGAGKSTLVSILYGLTQPDSGEICINGEAARLRHPSGAIQKGIGLVQQHFSLISNLSVLENIILGSEPAGTWRLNWTQAKQDVKRIVDEFGLGLPLDQLAGDLPVGLQQRVEIAKVLYRKAEILLFDEPTAALVTQEVERFLETLELLKQRGKAVVLITHRLAEVEKVADEVTVLRRGQVVLHSPMSQTTREAMAQAIIGESLPNEQYELPPVGNVVFSVKKLSCRSTSPQIQHAAFDLREGEILGIAGVTGNGQEGLVDLLIGQRRQDEGRIELCGERIESLNTASRRERKMALIPQDRHREGLWLERSLVENAMLNRNAAGRGQRGWLNPKKMAGEVAYHVQDYQVKADSVWQPVERLSGGHQQRFLIARELSNQPKVIIAYDPVRGLDVRAARFVHETLIQACRDGAAVLLFSSEIAELFLLCRRIAVLHNGTIVEIRDAAAWNTVALGKAMTGAVE